MEKLYYDIFTFPESSVVGKKMPKTVLSRHFTLSASDKKLLTNISAIKVLATLKPNNSNVVGVNTEYYDYPEIHLMSCTLPNNMLRENIDRCISLIQKNFPLQIALIVEDDSEFVINVCDKRINQVDKSKRTIEKYYTSSILSKLYKNEVTKDFFDSLSFANIDKTNMQTAYNSYVNALVQFKTANITGTFKIRSKSRTEEDMKFLAQIEDIEKDIASLKSKMKKEKQLNNKIYINVEIQKKKKQIEEIKQKL